LLCPMPCPPGHLSIMRQNTVGAAAARPLACWETPIHCASNSISGALRLSKDADRDNIRIAYRDALTVVLNSEPVILNSIQDWPI